MTKEEVIEQVKKIITKDMSLKNVKVKVNFKGKK